MHDGSNVWDPHAPNTPMHRPTTPQQTFGGGGGCGDNSFDAAWRVMGSDMPGSAFTSSSPSASGFPSSLADAPGGIGDSPFASYGTSPAYGTMPSPLGGGGAVGTLQPPSTPEAHAWTPGTPGANDNSIFDSAAPHAGSSQAQETLPENIEVAVTTEGHDNAKGRVVEAHNDGTYTVMLHDSVERVTVAESELSLVRPNKKDKIVIVRGENRGTLGTLIGIDGQDGIVKITSNSDIRILSLQDVCRLYEV